jgi:hypothetical protein
MVKAWLHWVLPYPGDWHIMKNLLPVIIKIYFDAGLKQLATICHHGSTLRTLVECTKWSVTHRFMVHAWEAMLRHHINSFLMSLSDEEVHHVGSDFSEIIVNVLSSFDFTLEQDTMLCDRAFTEDICRKKDHMVYSGKSCSYGTTTPTTRLQLSHLLKKCGSLYSRYVCI